MLYFEKRSPSSIMQNNKIIFLYNDNLPCLRTVLHTLNFINFKNCVVLKERFSAFSAIKRLKFITFK